MHHPRQCQRLPSLKPLQQLLTSEFHPAPGPSAELLGNALLCPADLLDGQFSIIFLKSGIKPLNESIYSRTLCTISVRRRLTKLLVGGTAAGTRSNLSLNGSAPRYDAARRVLFLVDRANLVRQTEKEFQQYVTPDDGRKFTALYDVQRLTSRTVDPASRVCISTIQRIYSMLRGEE